MLFHEQKPSVAPVWNRLHDLKTLQSNSENRCCFQWELSDFIGSVQLLTQLPIFIQKDNGNCQLLSGVDEESLGRSAFAGHVPAIRSGWTLWGRREVAVNSDWWRTWYGHETVMRKDASHYFTLRFKICSKTIFWKVVHGPEPDGFPIGPYVTFQCDVLRASVNCSN